MYEVTKEIHFCYGHRLLDYDGMCAHPHGHNGRVEITLRADSLDKRGMVVDFGDVKSIVQGWIDGELDHRMILRKGDPLAGALQSLGEPYFTMDDNPTAEALAKLVYRTAKSKGLPVTRVTFWETVSSKASYSE